MKMEFEPVLNRKGVTLMELMVALVISAIVIAGIYRVFISQTKSYYVQDQVMEVQQNTRNAMEMLLRDLRMTGFDDDNAKSFIAIATPITVVGDNSITVNYEYYDRNDSTYKKHTVAYWRDGGNATVFRQLSVNDVPNASEALLENVDALTFSYGIDQNDDGIVDNWVPAAGVGSIKVIAARVTLVARPEQANEDVRKIVSPRALDSIVSMRNLCLR
jgi:type IV pilus assembly protein PilW